jgi:benzoyl-CoA reductase/2-hydroxyglutaryl-CoA dehydratase subunit BcrC/BadD/HgdB
MTALEELSELSGTLCNPAIQRWKDQGKKVIGFTCSYVPEEILYAADLLPYRIRPTGCEQTPLADGIMKHINCSFVRSVLQYALEGKFDFLDGIVACDGCDHSRRLYDVLKEKAPFQFMHFVGAPHKTTDEAAAWYADELDLFKQSVERAFGVEVTEERLAEAIEIYEETRSLMRELYSLREGDRPLVSGEETLKIMMAGTAIPKGEYNTLLRESLRELRQRDGISDYTARLMIMGSDIDSPEYLRTIEKLGGLIVTDGLCFGTRYFWGTTNGDRSLPGLARLYLQRPECPRMADSVVPRANFAKEMVDTFKVDGVVCETMKYCDLWASQWFYLGQRFRELDVPYLSLEREYAAGNVAQLETRVQAFLETLEK